MSSEEEPISQMELDGPSKEGTGDADHEADGEEGEEGAEGAEGMEDAEAKAALLASLPEVSLDLFDLIKSAQGQHGLRHGDYGRYRQYCSRRLHRLRRVLKFQHGTKGRFVKRALEPVLVKDSRHLMLPLFCAERAWSLAMQLKRDKTSQEEPRPRYHLLHRLAKAAKWSATLAELSQVRGDQRTALEAEAYAAFMAGNNHLEREQWAPALAAFKRTSRICSELCRVSLSEQAYLYRQMVAEVDPSIRFCTYNLRRSGELPEGVDDDGDGVESLADAEGASDILRSKLEHVMQETRSKQAKHSMTDMEVLGERIPIKSDKTRVCMLRAKELLMEVEVAAQSSSSGAAKAESKSEDVMSLYDQLFVAFNDSLESVRTELRQVNKEHTAKAELAEAQLLRLQASLHWQKLHHTARRTLLLVERLGRGSVGDSSIGEKRKRTSPEDLVRLYDSVLGTLAEMSQLDLYKEHELLMGKLAARSASAKAFRCFHVAESYSAESYSGSDKWRKAQALYERSSKLLAEALALHEEYAAPHSGPESEGCVAGIGEDGAALAKLERTIDGAKARAQAQAVLIAANGTPAVAEAAKGVSQLRLKGGGKSESAAAGVPLLERLDQFLAKEPGFLIDFPPKLEAVPCKSLLFDMARNEIKAPDLSARTTSKRSTWGSWFGRG